MISVVTHIHILFTKRSTALFRVMERVVGVIEEAYLRLARTPLIAGGDCQGYPRGGQRVAGVCMEGRPHVFDFPPRKVGFSLSRDHIAGADEEVGLQLDNAGHCAVHRRFIPFGHRACEPA